MEIWYQIKTEDGWERVDFETYYAYDGVKRIWGPTHGIALLQKHLQPLRWM